MSVLFCHFQPLLTSSLVVDRALHIKLKQWLCRGKGYLKFTGYPGKGHTVACFGLDRLFVLLSLMLFLYVTFKTLAPVLEYVQPSPEVCAFFGKVRLHLVQLTIPKESMPRVFWVFFVVVTIKSVGDIKITVYTWCICALHVTTKERKHQMVDNELYLK